MDFADLPAIAENQPPRLDVTVTGGGQLTAQQLVPNPHAPGYRAILEVVAPGGASDIELRAVLRNDAHVLTETWSYLWQPKH